MDSAFPYRSISIKLWPPSQSTRLMLVERMTKNLTTPSILSRKYGLLDKEEAEEISKKIEALAYASTKLHFEKPHGDGSSAIQLYAKESSKLMLEAVKRGPLKAKEDGVVITEKATHDQSLPTQENEGKMERTKRLKEDSLLLLRRFDSVTNSLSQLSGNLDNALQERCSLLEEENRRLRDGFAKGIRPEEDDLMMRLQMEALLAEKSRLANENAALTRENQCLNQLVDQLTSQDLTESYEHEITGLITGLCLDFSSVLPTIPEKEESEDVYNEVPKTPFTDRHGFSFSE